MQGAYPNGTAFLSVEVLERQTTASQPARQQNSNTPLKSDSQIKNCLYTEFFFCICELFTLP